RTCCRASAGELSRMAEGTRVTAPRRGPSPAQIRRRRVAALAVGVLVLIAVVVAIVAAVPHVHRKHALPPPPPPPKPFRIVFPEGFTRAQMIKRVRDVALIARHKSGKPVRLNATAYAAATRHATIPCFRPRVQHNLEGFLFPSTYDFLAKT